MKDLKENFFDGVWFFKDFLGLKGLFYFGDILNYIKMSFDFNCFLKNYLENFDKYGLIYKRIVMGWIEIFIKNLIDVEVVFRGDGKNLMWFEMIFRV